MNPFVNPQKRGILLPNGCGDLMDVLQMSKRQPEAGWGSPLVKPEVQVSALVHVSRYLLGLAASTVRSRVLIIASSDAQMRVVIERSASGLTIYPVMGLADREKEVEEFFVARGVQPSVDFLVGHPGISTRVLGFPLPSDPGLAAGLTSDLIRSAYGLEPVAEVEFIYVTTATA